MLFGTTFNPRILAPTQQMESEANINTPQSRQNRNMQYIDLRFPPSKSPIPIVSSLNSCQIQRPISVLTKN